MLYTLEEIKAQGVDEIYCLSVNDAFVMRQWGIHQGMEKEEHDASNPLNPGNFKKVKLIPDGAALFTRGMGMSCVWESERGFGERSWRYSAVINDMKVEKLFVEVSLIRCLSFASIVCSFVFSSLCVIIRVELWCKTLVQIHSKSLMPPPC